MTRLAKPTGAAVTATPTTFPAIPPADVLGRLAALKTAPAADLQAQWRDLFGKEAPPHNRAFLQSRLAYRVQELAYGGLKPETLRRLEAMGEQLDGGNITLRRIRGDDKPITGTKLMRQYQGVEHAVVVRVDGYEWEGRPYRSLSAIARAITGTRWNGWTFFGLKTQAETRQALEQLDPLWDELFPAEQARIVRSLVERVDVSPAGADIRLRLDGLACLVRDLRASPVRQAA